MKNAQTPRSQIIQDLREAQAINRHEPMMPTYLFSGSARGSSPRRAAPTSTEIWRTPDHRSLSRPRWNTRNATWPALQWKQSKKEGSWPHGRLGDFREASPPSAGALREPSVVVKPTVAMRSRRSKYKTVQNCAAACWPPKRGHSVPSLLLFRVREPDVHATLAV
jgi:hypothetical protein